MRYLVALMIVLAGCASDAPVADTSTGEAPAPPVLAPMYQNFTGVLTSTIITPDEATGAFTVPATTGRITATLLWDDPLADLSFHLDAQNATGHQGGYYAGGAGSVVADIPGPAAGDWDYRIVGDNAINVAWTLVVFMAPDNAIATVLQATELVAAGQFLEINTEMVQGESMQWSWRISEGSSSDFNLHTHFDDEVQYLVEESANSGSGNVTADRTGGYSLMWENPGAAPQTIEYTVWGNFTVDSYFPPR